MRLAEPLAIKIGFAALAGAAHWLWAAVAGWQAAVRISVATAPACCSNLAGEVRMSLALRSPVARRG